MSNSSPSADRRVTDAELEKAIEAFREAVEAAPMLSAMDHYTDGDQIALNAMLELQQIRRRRG